MSVRIEEVFQVGAPPELVWAYLTDPQQVAPCLPGANLTEVIDEKTYAGTIKVKVGPVTAGYRGKIQITEQDDAARTVQMLGEGMESSGAGSAKMTLSSQVIALDDGGTEVKVQQDVEVVGKLAQFGRGMVQEVGKQLFRQFVACAKAHLEAEAATAAAPGGSPEAQGAPAPDVSAGATDDAGAAAGDPGAPPAGDQPASAPAGSTGGGASTPPPAPPAQDEAIGGISLFLKALWSLITRPFRKS